MKLIIGKALKMRREKQGLSQKAFAKKIGISVQHYSAVEQEKYPLPAKYWDRVEAELGVSIDQLKQENKRGEDLPAQGSTVALDEYRKAILEMAALNHKIIELQNEIQVLKSIFNPDKPLSEDQVKVYMELQKLDRPGFYKKLYYYLLLNRTELMVRLELNNSEDAIEQAAADRDFQRVSSSETKLPAITSNRGGRKPR